MSEGRAARDALEAARLAAHRGLATWGERQVPLAEFHAAAQAHGEELSPAARRAARAALLGRPPDATPVEGPFSRIAVCGGVYSNRQALAAFIADAAARGAEALYCLGDLGGFGPHPEACWPLLEQAGIRCVQGNYEQSLAGGAEDCNCGYTDPRDNHFARLSYEYTARHCSPAFKRWMGELPPRRRVRVGGSELLLVHGSPRRVNEFLFASATSRALLATLCEQERCDGFLCTHTGLPWQRRLPSPAGGEWLVANVGALGRPANDGDPRVRYALVSAGDGGEANVEIVSLGYDHQALIAEMRAEQLPEEFVATIASGWWTTCLEVLPARERQASRF
ncbi:MAG TPA: metallophosphoesterase family protein [Thermoanaerobaculia bacterium]|nr:metallophosphoesterase family protein [Thermoanaerobaculia bacterium]